MIQNTAKPMVAKGCKGVQYPIMDIVYLLDIFFSVIFQSLVINNRNMWRKFARTKETTKKHLVLVAQSPKS